MMIELAVPLYWLYKLICRKAATFFIFIRIQLVEMHFAYMPIVGTDVIQDFLINFLLIPRYIHIHHIARATKTSQILKASYAYNIHVSMYLNHIAHIQAAHYTESSREKYDYLLIIYMLHYDDDKSETFNINITQLMDI